MYSRLIFGILVGILVLSTSHIVEAKDGLSPVALLMKHKIKSNNTHFPNPNNDLNVEELDLPLTKAEYRDVEKNLVEAYGPATQSRANIRIWEIKNTSKAANQSKIVTIMAGEENGEYFAKLDRRGPGTSNNSKIQPYNAKPLYILD